MTTITGYGGTVTISGVEVDVKTLAVVGGNTRWDAVR